MICLASAAGWTDSSADSRLSMMSTGRALILSFPVITRETSSRSDTSCAWARAFRSILSNAFVVAVLSSAPWRSICDHPRIAFRGERIS